jgi:hypothetical protein
MTERLKLEFDVLLNGKHYLLVRDPAHVHPPELLHHLGIDTVQGDTEAAVRRLIDALEADDWFDEGTHRYVGRDPFGIGLVGRD